MTAQLGNNGIIDRDAHVVNPGTAGSRDFPSGGHQGVAELARPDKGYVALRSDRALVVGVASECKSRIRERENEAAMGDAMSVDHVRLDGHCQHGLASFHLQDLHAKTLA